VIGGALGGLDTDIEAMPMPCEKHVWEVEGTLVRHIFSQERSVDWLEGEVKERTVPGSGGGIKVDALMSNNGTQVSCYYCNCDVQVTFQTPRNAARYSF
jgi:hypothetical protein